MGVPAAAAFDNMVAAWKYVMMLAGSVGLAGMAKSTCKGRRRAMLPTYATWSEECAVIWRENERLKVCVYGVFRLWSSPQLMAKASLPGVYGKPPAGVGPNKQPGPFKEGHAGGKQDCPVRQVKRGASAGLTTPAGLPSWVESPKDPCWSKLFTTGMPKWSYMML